MKNTMEDDWNSYDNYPIYFRKEKGLLTPGYEDNIVYDRYINDDDKNWVMEVDKGRPDDDDKLQPGSIRRALADYLKERLYYNESAIDFHMYGLGYASSLSKVVQWQYSFDFFINDDKVLLKRTSDGLTLYINKKIEKFTDGSTYISGMKDLPFVLEDLYKYLDKKYFAEDYKIGSLDYDLYMDLLVKPYFTINDKSDFKYARVAARTETGLKKEEDWKNNKDPMKNFINHRRESHTSHELLNIFNEVLKNNR